MRLIGAGFATLLLATTASRAAVVYTVRDPNSGAYFSTTSSTFFTDDQLAQGGQIEVPLSTCTNCFDGQAVVHTFNHQTLFSYSTLQASFNGGYFPDSDFKSVGTYHESIGMTLGLFSPDATLTVGKTGSSFAALASNAWTSPSVNGNHIENLYQPSSISLADLAQLGGFDHFNVEQRITSITLVGGRSIPPVVIFNQPSVGLDPRIGGNIPEFGIQPADDYPWYLEEVPVSGSKQKTVAESETGTYLAWDDNPDLFIDNAGVQLHFTDYLVGVYADHSGVVISDLYPDAQNVNFDWTFTQGLWGGTADYADLATASSDGTPTPGSEGSITFDGFFGNDETQLSLPIAADTGVPEPLTLSLFSVGATGAFFARRRKTAKPPSQAA